MTDTTVNLETTEEISIYEDIKQQEKMQKSII